MCRPPTPCRSLRTSPWPLPGSSRRCRPVCRRRHACRRRSSSPVRSSVMPRGGRTHGRPRRGPRLRRRGRGRGTARRGAPLRPALCRGHGPGQELPGRFTRADLPASQGQGRPRPAGPPGPGLHRGTPGLVPRRAVRWPGPPRRSRAGPASGRRLRATPQNEPIAPSEPVEAAPCPHTRPTVFGLHHRCSLRRRHHIRFPDSENPRTVKGSDRP